MGDDDKDEAPRSTSNPAPLYMHGDGGSAGGEPGEDDRARLVGTLAGPGAPPSRPGADASGTDDPTCERALAPNLSFRSHLWLGSNQ